MKSFHIAVAMAVLACVTMADGPAKDVRVEGGAAGWGGSPDLAIPGQADKEGYVLSPEQVEQIRALLANDLPDDDLEPLGPYEGTAVENNAFPGDIRGMQNVNSIVRDQIDALLKSTGASLPSDIDAKVSPERMQGFLTWYNMTWLAFNLVMRYVFGDGPVGAVVVGTLCIFFVFVIPYSWQKRRERAMTTWLTAFYLEHAPDNIIRVPKAVEAYSSLGRHGFTRLKADCLEKYVNRKKTQ
ncbi:hypothetical protein DYB32_000036 [Aphanomyces invadans]|uniref:Uncharacterized protein n=1 Tax=Aphanomyces invadans TaxID=157072 RepID=A0A418BB71_9STRA|nr:hypothetical protein DYB32_000036 [Aphanomyces invadans]